MKMLRNLSVGFKLIALLAVLLVSAVATLTGLSVWLFRQDNTLLVQQLNAHDASGLAASVRETLDGMIPKAEVFGRILARGTADSEDGAISDAFQRFPEILAVATAAGKTVTATAVAPSIAATGDTNASEWAKRALASASNDISIDWLALSEKHSALALTFPFQNGTLVAFIDPKRIEDGFSRTDGVSAYLVGRDGSMLAHSDRPIAKKEKSELPGLQDFLNGKLTNRQLRYVDSATGEAKMVAFRQVGFSKLGVVAEVPESVALDASRRVVKLATLVAFLIFCGAMLLGSIYSGFLVSPILGLTEATQKIAEGKFDTRVSVAAEGGDEIAQLGRAFNNMAVGLEEKERYRDTFAKFHSKEVAERLLSGNVKLGGDKLDATILFCDLRGFTAMSETVSPEVVVETLNEYMSRMVKVIRQHGGTIDKFIGDAILATWGVPFGKPDDASNAVSACLEMRRELQSLNASRAKKWRNPLKMGMALNRGPVIAGNIGSEERMEYTVIGDAVNVASRLESMTKELGVDLLISETVQSLAQGRFGFELGPKVKVWGRAEEIQVYKIPSREAVAEAPTETKKKAG